MRERGWLCRLAALELVAVGQPDNAGPLVELDTRTRAAELRACAHAGTQLHTLHDRVRPTQHRVRPIHHRVRALDHGVRGLLLER